MADYDILASKEYVDGLVPGGSQIITLSPFPSVASGTLRLVRWGKARVLHVSISMLSGRNSNTFAGLYNMDRPAVLFKDALFTAPTTTASLVHNVWINTDGDVFVASNITIADTPSLEGALTWLVA